MLAVNPFPFPLDRLAAIEYTFVAVGTSEIRSREPVIGPRRERFPSKMHVGGKPERRGFFLSWEPDEACLDTVHAEL